MATRLDSSKIKETILLFRQERKETFRYASYDFCYLYFQEHKGHLAENMENSCMHLWSYLASWGMLRGSSKLRLRSPAALKELIAHFDETAKANPKLWELDVDKYNDATIQNLINEYNAIGDILEKIISDEKDKTYPSITLITKIMLGVYGNIPAFDTYFIQTFHSMFGGFGVCKEKELKNIHIFYINNKELLEKLQEEIKVVDFNGHSTDYHYKLAKLIDMYGFSLNAPKDN